MALESLAGTSGEEDSVIEIPELEESSSGESGAGAKKDRAGTPHTAAPGRKTSSQSFTV